MTGAIFPRTSATSATSPRREACSRISPSRRTWLSAFPAASVTARGSAICSTPSPSPAWPGAIPISSPAASSSGWHWPAPSPSRPGWSCWTSRSPRSTRTCGPASAPTCAPSSATPAITAILVTHDQDEALSSADYVAVIRDGIIAQFATPQDLYDHPADADLARFVGDANLLDGFTEGGLVRTPLGMLAVRGDLSLAPGKTGHRADPPRATRRPPRCGWPGRPRPGDQQQLPRP